MSIVSKAARPLETSVGALMAGGRNSKVSPTKTVGAPGTAIYGGFVVSNEEDKTLVGRERYRVFSQALANCSVVAAGVRYFLNLCAKASWTFTPTDHPESEELTEKVEEMLMEDPSTSWARIVRRAAMYRFYGFSLQEWTAKRRADGIITFADIAPRAQITIERWDVDVTGKVLGVVQRNPQDSKEIYLPRKKTVYLVDDTLNDSPEGLGLFRHIVEPVRRLAVYEQLEGFGLTSDLRGIPVGRAPYAELRQQEQAGEITPEQAKMATQPIETFIQKHIKSPDLGILLDSDVFTSTDEATRPSSVRKFDVDLLKGSSTALPDIAKAIDRVNREIARILGVEAILLGEGDKGSFALARDKTNQFSLTVDATLEELAQGFRDDLLKTIWALNGWPEEAMPEMTPEAVQYRDIEQITQALRDMAQAGAPLDLDDPVINEVRALLGLSPTDSLTAETNVLDSAIKPPKPEDDLKDLDDGAEA